MRRSNSSARSISALIALAMGVASATQSFAGNAAKPVAFSTFGSAPLYFEANAGQFESKAPFIARGTECTVTLAPTDAEILLGKPGAQSVPRAVHLRLVGANAASAMTGRDRMAARANYFIGNETGKWRTGVPLFSRVQVDQVYPGVQVVYYANQSAQLEYDFLVQPDANPDQIRFQITGADNVRVDQSGDLALKIGNQEIRQHQPVVYQEKDGARTEVAGSYRLNADGTVSFALASYDRSLPLVIDPTLDFLTYIGGKKMDLGWAIALDPSGNIYVAGESLSTDLPTTNALVFDGVDYGQFRGGNKAFGDAFVAKYDNTGALQFLTYLGGKTDDGALGIAYDASGSPGVWITGFTDSTNFPLQNPIHPALTGPNKNSKRVFTTDAFITKLDPDGTTVLFSTYFGGENIDEGTSVAVDKDNSGGVYVTGLTMSTNLPGMLPNAFQTRVAGQLDAFVTKLIPNPAIVNAYTNAYTTYLGGTNLDYGTSIAVDSAHDAWITGLTYSTNFFTTNALQVAPGEDSFYTNGFTFAYLNTDTNAVKHNASLRSDAFVAEISPDGSSVPFSSYLGGSNDDVGQDIYVDNSDNVFVTGYTASLNFPTNRITATPTPDDINQYAFLHPGTNFFSHVFVTEISHGALAYSVHFGGSLADQGIGIAVDDNGLTYVTGSASSTNFFPTVLLVTNSVPVTKHGTTTTNYFGIVTNSPAFTDLGSTNEAIRLKHKGNTNDVFVVVLSPEFTNFNQQILVRGPGEDLANGIAIDPSGSAVYLVGSTTSRTNFATTNAAQTTFGSNKGGGNRIPDAFVSKIQIVPAP